MERSFVLHGITFERFGTGTEHVLSAACRRLICVVLITNLMYNYEVKIRSSEVLFENKQCLETQNIVR